MALQIDITNTPLGVGFQQAYARIVTCAITRQRAGAAKHSVMIDVAVYATVPTDDTREVDFRRYHTPLENLGDGDTLPAAYTWLMAQPDFDGAVAA